MKVDLATKYGDPNPLIFFLNTEDLEVLLPLSMNTDPSVPDLEQAA